MDSSARCRYATRTPPGVLGALSTAIGITGANIGNIQTVRISQNHVLRDIDIYVEDQEHLNETLRAIARVHPA